LHGNPVEPRLVKRKIRAKMDIFEAFHILEIEPTASADEIALAYRDLVRVWHPDRFTSTPRLQEKANEKLRWINEAYTTVMTYRKSGTPRRETAGAHSFGMKPDSPLEHKSMGMWRRPVARFFDYCLWAVLLRQAGIISLFPDLGVPLISIPMLVLFSWIPVESLLLVTAGTTPGKWLLSLKILRRGGITGLTALKRSTAVWCHGMAIGIPFLAPFTIAIAYKMLSRSSTSIWDKAAGTEVVIEAPSIKRLSAAAVFSVLLLSIQAAPPLIGGPQESISRETAGTRADLDGRDAIESDESSLRKQASFYKEKGRHGPAIEVLSRLKALCPEDPDVYRDLGNVLLHAGRAGEASETFSALIDLTPEDPDAHHLAGKALAKSGNQQAAVKALKRSTKIEPRHKNARHSLGLSYIALGKPLSAIMQYRILLDLDRPLADELLEYIHQAFGAIAL
jgi:uncharacterized RDD family membrane protein YckC